MTDTSPTPHVPRDITGRRYCRHGKRMIGDPRPQSMLDVVQQKNALHRSLRAVTGGLRELEYAAEVCAELNIRYPEDAVRFIRRRELGDRFDGLPLCELEKLIAKRANSFVILCAYGMVAPAIERQLRVLLVVRDAQQPHGSLEQTAETGSA
ncbi:MAG: hypothetical protein JWM36_2753 [Hyphomicrobiales bacterium]|nr:hypothetical protein [Hyphomicrobiales bacterium]